MKDLDGLVDEAVALLEASRHAVALTGAGMSTPSGIPDFRSQASGLWEWVDPMEVASIYAFQRRPETFYDWVRPLAELILQAEPNEAHVAMAQLEAQGYLQCVITQNIDMLHSRAGSKCVYEVHGQLREATCISCYRVTDGEESAKMLETFVVNGEVPRCSDCGGVLKPNVILYGELLPVKVLHEAKSQVMAADLMLVAGSSLEVAPAGDLPLLTGRARQESGEGSHLIIVNLDQTRFDHMADVVIHADVAEVLPRVAAAVGC